MSLKNNSILQKLKTLASDSILTISALVIMNCVAQFVIYPLWARVFGDEHYGNIIYVMSLVNTFAVSMGVSANYARMVESAKRTTCNGDYNCILSACSVISGTLCFGIILFSDLNMSTAEVVLAAILAVLTMWRFYADVEYRLSLNFKGYFLYYMVISIGYGFGAFLFLQTKLWPLALIPGEVLGLLLVYLKGGLFRSKPFARSKEFLANVKYTGVLTTSNIIDNLIFNGDRLLLQIALNGTSVTLYYLASLLGKTMSLISTPLNSVIMGYLARYKGEFNRKTFFLILGGTVLAVLFATAATVLGSHILISVLYADSYAGVKDYFIIANLTQVIYFTTNVVTTILLRFAKVNFTLVVNSLYGVAFVLLCVPAAFLLGVDGFCFALLLVNIIRYMVAMVYCWIYFGRRKEIANIN